MESPQSSEEAELYRAYNKQLQLLAAYCVTIDTVLENTRWLCEALGQQVLGEPQRSQTRRVCRYIPGIQQRARAFQDIIRRSYIGPPLPPLTIDPPDPAETDDAPERKERSA